MLGTHSDTYTVSVLEAKQNKYQQQLCNMYFCPYTASSL